MVEAKPGEDYAKGSSHVIWAAWIAAVLVTAAVAFYVIVNQKSPVATGEIVAVWAHPQHAQSSGVDANGESMAQVSFDQVLVFTQVRLHNQSKGPLYLHNVMTNIKLDDGIHSSYAATAADYDRVYIAYPNHARAPRNGRWPPPIRPSRRGKPGGDFRLVVPFKQATVGRPQRPEFHLCLALSAKSYADAPGPCYRPVVTGAGALFGVERYPVTVFLALTEFTTTSNSIGSLPA